MREGATKTMRLITTTLGLIACFAFVAQAQDQERPDPWSRVIERADQDGDGQINKEEFRGPPERFEELDANKDGFISKDEFKPREAGARRGGRGGQRGPQPGHMLVHSADQDKSGDVTEAEQVAFLASLKADADGVIDPKALGERLKAGRPQDGRGPRGPRGEGRRGPKGDKGGDRAAIFDKDKSGKIELKDIKAFFADLDKNKDGTIAKDEMPQRQGRRGRRGGGRMGGMLLIRAADKDQSGDVTANEWLDLVNTLTENGTADVSLEKLKAAMPPRPEGREGRGPRGGRGGDAGAMLTRALDKDQDGKATAKDLAAIFAELDKNQDGALGADEMPKRGRDGRGGGRGGRGPKGGPGK